MIFCVRVQRAVSRRSFSFLRRLQRSNELLSTRLTRRISFLTERSTLRPFEHSRARSKLLYRGGNWHTRARAQIKKNSWQIFVLFMDFCVFPFLFFFISASGNILIWLPSKRCYSLMLMRPFRLLFFFFFLCKCRFHTTQCSSWDWRALLWLPNHFWVSFSLGHETVITGWNTIMSFLVRRIHVFFFFFFLFKLFSPYRFPRHQPSNDAIPTLFFFLLFHLNDEINRQSLFFNATTKNKTSRSKQREREREKGAKMNGAR